VEIIIGHAAELRLLGVGRFNQTGNRVVEIAVVFFDTDTWRASAYRINRVNPETG
jgi:hypothetical protein